jgi:hypothetical protein
MIGVPSACFSSYFRPALPQCALTITSTLLLLVLLFDSSHILNFMLSIESIFGSLRNLSELIEYQTASIKITMRAMLDLRHEAHSLAGTPYTLVPHRT